MRLNTLVSVAYLLIPIRLHLIKNNATAYYLKVRVKFLLAFLKFLLL